MNRLKKSWIALGMLMMVVVSCKKKTYSGEGYLNYPSMNKIIQDNLKPMEKQLITFRLITLTGTRRDTQYLHSEQVNWSYWEEAFMKADIYKKSLDREYAITATTDTMSHTITYMYESLNRSNGTKRMTLYANSADNTITSIYAETNNSGFFSSSSYKLLFAFGRSLQVQEFSKKPFQKSKQIVRTLEVMN